MRHLKIYMYEETKIILIHWKNVEPIFVDHNTNLEHFFKSLLNNQKLKQISLLDSLYNKNTVQQMK